MSDLNRKHDEFVQEIVALKAKAGQLGFYRTMQAMERVTQEVGWEVAIHRDPSQRKARDKYMAMKE